MFQQLITWQMEQGGQIHPTPNCYFCDDNVTWHPDSDVEAALWLTFGLDREWP